MWFEESWWQQQPAVQYQNLFLYCCIWSNKSPGIKLTTTDSNKKPPFCICPPCWVLIFLWKDGLGFSAPKTSSFMVWLPMKFQTLSICLLMPSVPNYLLVADTRNRLHTMCSALHKNGIWFKNIWKLAVFYTFTAWLYWSNIGIKMVIKCTNYFCAGCTVDFLLITRSLSNIIAKELIFAIWLFSY